MHDRIHLGGVFLVGGETSYRFEGAGPIAAPAARAFDELLCGGRHLGHVVSLQLAAAPYIITKVRWSTGTAWYSTGGVRPRRRLASSSGSKRTRSKSSPGSQAARLPRRRASRRALRACFAAGPCARRKPPPATNARPSPWVSWNVKAKRHISPSASRP